MTIGRSVRWLAAVGVFVCGCVASGPTRIGDAPAEEPPPTQPPPTQPPIAEPDPEQGTPVEPDPGLPPAWFSIDKLEPVTGRTAGHELVVIKGQGFEEGLIVTFDGVPATQVIVHSPVVIHAFSPPHAAGMVDVEIHEPKEGARTTMADGFLYEDALAITAVEPQSGRADGGEPVLVYGKGFVEGTALLFGGRLAINITIIDGETIAAITPPGSPGLDDVIVATPWDVARLDDAFVRESPPSGPIGLADGLPRIHAVGPKTEDPAGGGQLTITGQRLDGATEVRVGALPATILSAGEGLIKVTLPPGSPGAADVRVQTDDGHDVLVGGFTYIPPDGPEIYAVTPGYGAIAGDTLVSVYGAGFGQLATAQFGAMEAESTVVSTTEIQARTPQAIKGGVVDVGVVQGLLKLNARAAYSYFDPRSAWGGSSGPPIDGALNVTVLCWCPIPEPIEGVFVMLGDDPSTPYQGLTDYRGQITFSGPGLDGQQLVTAAKSMHSTATVFAYDAENVTLHLVWPDQ